MLIRPGTPADAGDIHALIRCVAEACCFSAAQPAPAWFLASIETPCIAAMLTDPVYAVRVAERDNVILGVLVLRDGSHVQYLFVEVAQQRQGIAAQLWRAAQAEGLLSAAQITVRSSLNAVAAYQHLGFRCVGATAEYQGMFYQQMERVQ